MPLDRRRLLLAAYALFSAPLLHAQGTPPKALIGAFRRVAEKGGLLSHYSDIEENFRRAAMLVDKILKGANPAELAVEQPDRFLTPINLRTAKTLGITIPQSMLLQATRVIE